MDNITIETKRMYDIGVPYMMGGSVPILRMWEKNNTVYEVHICGWKAPIGQLSAIRAALNQATQAGLIPNP